MITLESIVRPFQSINFTPGIKDPDATPPNSVGNMVLSVGSFGNLKKLSGSMSGGESHYMDQKHTETTRHVQNYKIVNPDDTAQHADVGVAQKLTTVGPNGQKVKYVFKGVQGTPTGAPYDITS